MGHAPLFSSGSRISQRKRQPYLKGGGATYNSAKCVSKLHGTRYGRGYSQNFESSSFVDIGYRWLPLATTQLMVENRELEL